MTSSIQPKQPETQPLQPEGLDDNVSLGGLAKRKPFDMRAACMRGMKKALVDTLRDLYLLKRRCPSAVELEKAVAGSVRKIDDSSRRFCVMEPTSRQAALDEQVPDLTQSSRQDEEGHAGRKLLVDLVGGKVVHAVTERSGFVGRAFDITVSAIKQDPSSDKNRVRDKVLQGATQFGVIECAAALGGMSTLTLVAAEATGDAAGSALGHVNKFLDEFSQREDMREPMVCEGVCLRPYAPPGGIGEDLLSPDRSVYEAAQQIRALLEGLHKFSQGAHWAEDKVAEAGKELLDKVHMTDEEVKEALRKFCTFLSQNVPDPEQDPVELFLPPPI